METTDGIEPAKNFENAYTRLQELLAEMESHDLPIDQLAPKVAEAKALAAFCVDCLRKTREAIGPLD